MDLAQIICRRFSALKSEHSKWSAVWQDCARFTLPTFYPLGVFAPKTRGGKKRQPIDITGVACLTKLASWLFSSTIYQGEQWFDLKAVRKRVNGTEIVDAALDKVMQEASRTTLEVIANSNCVPVYQRFLRGYCGFGTGAFYSEFNENDELVCRQWNVSEGICIAENSKGAIDTVFRSFEYTARQAVQEFGEENLSEDIRKAAADEKEQETRFTFIHAVYPRRKRDRRKTNPENKPIASVYVEEKAQKVVLEGGYDTMPYQTPRFYDTGEIYGRSPSMSAIPALKSINIAIWSYLKNVEGSAKPIVFAPSDVADKMSLEFGAINPWDSGAGEIKIWSPVGDLKSPLEFAAQKKAEVESIFYNDVFQYLEDRKNMTATEAQLRYDEMIQGISPVLANLHAEFFSPFITRVARELFARGRIKIPRQYLDRKNGMPKFEVVYNTRLDTKLKGVLNANIINFVRMVGELVVAIKTAPLAGAYLDMDKIIKLYARNNNVSNDALKDEEEIAEALEVLNQQQQAQQAASLINKIDLQKTPERGSAQDTMINAM